MKKGITVNSYVKPISPGVQYTELNSSLAAQVQDTRRNLLGTLNDIGSRPSAIEEGAPEHMETKETLIKSVDAPDDDCIKIYLRIRPFMVEEMVRKEDQKCIETQSADAIFAHPPPESTTFKNHLQLYGTGDREHKFTFSRVFADKITQQQFFEDTTQHYVRNVVLGHDALLFSYGVTNGGKTYTFQGTETDPGLIPRSMEMLFHAIKEKVIAEPNVMPRMFCDYEHIDAKKRSELASVKAALLKVLDLEDADLFLTQATGSSASSGGLTAGESTMGSSQSSLQSVGECTSRIGDQSLGNFRCSVWVSFFEIYNEQVYDLLVPVNANAKSKDRQSLKVSEDRRGNVYVKGLGEYNVTSADEAIKLAMVGRRNLQIAATRLNYNSSRSHCVYAIRVLREFTRTDGSTGCQISRLSFCDLAGSERTSKIEGCSDRLKETGSINASLLTLGRCIRVLRWNQKHRNQPQIIPYRESKLTRLFQHYLSGRAKACMIVNINQCASSFDETLNVLKFSAVAKEVKTMKDPLPLNIACRAPVASPPPPPAKFSLLLNQFRGAKRSIVWADKAAETAAPSEQPLGQDLPEDENEQEADDTNLLDRTLDENNAIIQQYLSVIEDLRTKLVAARQKNLMMEIEIREEVCNEYGKLFREMEQHYTDDRDEAVADAEQLAEDRLELFVQSVKKRRRTEGKVLMDDNDSERDDDDAWVPAENLQAKEKECEDLRQELQQLKSQSASQSAGENTVTNSSTETYVNEISSLKELIQKQNREIEDLKETLDEAAKTFEEQRDQIRFLEQTNMTLGKDLETRSNGLNASEALLAEKNDEVASLKKKQGELEVKIVELEREIENANKTVVDLKAEKFEALCKQEILSQQLAGLESDLQKQSNQQVSALCLEKEAIETTLRETMEKMAEMEMNMAELTKAVNDSKEELDLISTEYEQRLDFLTVALEDAEKETLHVRDLMRQIEKDMTESVAKASLIEDTAARLQETVSRLEAEKQAVDDRLGDLVKKAEEHKKVLTGKVAELEKVAAENERLKASLDEAERKLETLQISCVMNQTEETTLFDISHAPARGKHGRTDRRGKGRAASANEDVTSDATSASLASRENSPKAPVTRSQRKTRAKNAAGKPASVDFPFMDDAPSNAKGRPRRKAAQVSSCITNAVLMAEGKETDHSEDTKPAAATGSDVSMKRRARRDLFVDPTVPVCSPVVEEPMSAAIGATRKKHQ